MRILFIAIVLVGIFVCGLALGMHRHNPVNSAVRSIFASLSLMDNPMNAYWLNRVATFEAVTRKADVVLLGDSLTDFGEWPDLLPDLSVQNRGISGDTVWGVQKRLDQIWRSEPRIVFLMIGINDLHKGISPDEVISRYRELASSVGSRVRLVAQSILFNYDSEMNRKIAHVNAAIEDLCRTSARCEYLDVNAVIAPDGRMLPEMTTDGVHLSAKGYVTWAKVIAPIVRSASGNTPASG